MIALLAALACVGADALCDAQVACEGGSEATCVALWETSAADADDAGCGPEHGDLERCVGKEGRCEGGRFDRSACDPETEALRACLDGA